MWSLWKLGGRCSSGDRETGDDVWAGGMEAAAVAVAVAVEGKGLRDTVKLVGCNTSASVPAAAAGCRFPASW